MTSSQESSKLNSIGAAVIDLESLAGWVHPHAIEVQEFSYYGLVIDVRSTTEFEEDHLPGAVSLANAGFRVGGANADPTVVEPGVDEPLSADLAALVAPIKFDQTILIYCARGGRDSGPIAKALRGRGWTVDTLPGGWINYRRWVQAGLEALPRLIGFRMVTGSLGGEVARFLGGLSRAGEQVLDVGAIAGLAAAAPRVSAQPTQAGFETQLLQALRQMDPHRAVWVGDVDLQPVGVSLPGALEDALRVAPAATLVCPQAERLTCWREDELMRGKGRDELVPDTAASSSSFVPVGNSVDQGRSDAEQQLTDLLAARDERWRSQGDARGGKRAELPALITDSLAPDRLLLAIEAWLPQVQPSARG